MIVQCGRHAARPGVAPTRDRTAQRGRRDPRRTRYQRHREATSDRRAQRATREEMMHPPSPSPKSVDPISGVPVLKGYGPSSNSRSPAASRRPFAFGYNETRCRSGAPARINEHGPPSNTLQPSPSSPCRSLVPDRQPPKRHIWLAGGESAQARRARLSLPPYPGTFVVRVCSGQPRAQVFCP